MNAPNFKKWKCGCKTWKDGKVFYIRPCSRECRVFRMVMEESRKRGNMILDMKES